MRLQCVEGVSFQASTFCCILLCRVEKGHRLTSLERLLEALLLLTHSDQNKSDIHSAASLSRSKTIQSHEYNETKGF